MKIKKSCWTERQVCCQLCLQAEQKRGWERGMTLLEDLKAKELDLRRVQKIVRSFLKQSGSHSDSSADHLASMHYSDLSSNMKQ